MSRVVAGVLAGAALSVGAWTAPAAGAGPAVAEDPGLAGGQQWYLRNDGGDGGAVDADIDAPEAWTTAQGAGALVAVIDSGCDTAHPDLDGQLWDNPGELDNGRDDDLNGFVDDLHGVDLHDRDGDPTDQEGHGTHIAGVIAAAADGAGIVGVAPHADVMCVRVLGADGEGPLRTIADGVDYATAHGADIINLSLGVNIKTNADQVGADELGAAIRRAEGTGILVVCAAGNDGADFRALRSFPSTMEAHTRNVLGVAATDRADLMPSWSDFDAHGQGLLGAPGEQILSTAMTSSGEHWKHMSGTSMAAPMVSGAAALIVSARPRLWAPAIRAALRAGADRLPSLAGKVAAGRRLNAAGALAALDADRRAPSGGKIRRVRAGGRQITVQAAGARDSSPVTYHLVIDGHLRAAAQPSRSAQAVQLTAPAPAGRRHVSVLAVDQAGNMRRLPAARTVTVRR